MGNPYDLSEGPKGAKGLRRPACGDDERYATEHLTSAEREWSYRARAEKAEEERDAALIELEWATEERDVLRSTLRRLDLAALVLFKSGDLTVGHVVGEMQGLWDAKELMHAAASRQMIRVERNEAATEEAE